MKTGETSTNNRYVIGELYEFLYWYLYPTLDSLRTHRIQQSAKSLYSLKTVRNEKIFVNEPLNCILLECVYEKDGFRSCKILSSHGISWVDSSYLKPI